MPKCPNCGSHKTRTHNPPAMKRTKDYRCKKCGNTFNNNSRVSKKYGFW